MKKTFLFANDRLHFKISIWVWFIAMEHWKGFTSFIQIELLKEKENWKKKLIHTHNGKIIFKLILSQQLFLVHPACCQHSILWFNGLKRVVHFVPEALWFPSHYRLLSRSHFILVCRSLSLFSFDIFKYVLVFLFVLKWYGAWDFAKIRQMVAQTNHIAWWININRIQRANKNKNIKLFFSSSKRSGYNAAEISVSPEAATFYSIYIVKVRILLIRCTHIHAHKWARAQ